MMEHFYFSESVKLETTSHWCLRNYRTLVAKTSCSNVKKHLHAKIGSRGTVLTLALGGLDADRIHEGGFSIC